MCVLSLEGSRLIRVLCKRSHSEDDRRRQRREVPLLVLKTVLLHLAKVSYGISVVVFDSLRNKLRLFKHHNQPLPLLFLTIYDMFVIKISVSKFTNIT
jgi:hypothetical protein